MKTVIRPPMTAPVLLFSMAFAVSTNVSASQHVGTVTDVEGAVQVFANPGTDPEKVPAPRVKFEDKFYTFRSIAIGDRLEKGNVIRTAPGAKARVVFDNGDQINVGSGSSYKISWSEASDNQPEINLLYGQIRGVISKKGPRNSLRIKTRSATMGVRGTDFFISHDLSERNTEVAVIRGAVEVKKPDAAEKPVNVKPGMSASVVATPTPSEAGRETASVAEPPKAVGVHQTSKEELVAIEVASTVSEKKREQAGNEVKDKLGSLEKAAVAVTLDDIKTHNPEMFAKIDTASVTSTKEINTTAVKTLIAAAPSLPPTRKRAFRMDLDSIDRDIYNKYIYTK